MSSVKVRKENRVLHVPEGRVDKFLKQGYDQIDQAGKVVKRATGGRMVTLQEFNKLVDENERLKKQIELSKLSGDELKAKLDEKKIAYATNDSKESLISKIIEGDK